MRTLAFLLAAMMAAAVAVFPLANGAVSQSAGVPVSGELSDGGTFEGTVSELEASTNEAGEVVVGGVLNGTATQANGETAEVTNQQFSEPVSLQEGERCDILFLDLGPLFLDLLGLEVNLDPIVLDIDAVPGAGNLLGNLLCAITGLLDNPGNPSNAIANLLDRVFGLLE
ncbi:MAG: ABC transporter substrate-binding protein [Rubrobacteraceae bacterium]